MDKHDVENTDTTVDEVRRKLLKIGIYSVPAIMFIGTASIARASGSDRCVPKGPPIGVPPGPPDCLPPGQS
jgi:hypothetical protein